MNVLLSPRKPAISLSSFAIFFLSIGTRDGGCPRPELVLIAIIGLSSGIEVSPGLNNNGDVPLHRDADERSRQRYSGANARANGGANVIKI